MLKQLCATLGATLTLLSLALLTAVSFGWMSWADDGQSALTGFLIWCGMVALGSTLFAIGTWRSSTEAGGTHQG